MKFLIIETQILLSLLSRLPDEMCLSYWIVLDRNLGVLCLLRRLLKRGVKVAVLLPVVVKDASETEAPMYSMDVEDWADWADRIEARGARAQLYLPVKTSTVWTADGGSLSTDVRTE